MQLETDPQKKMAIYKAYLDKQMQEKRKADLANIKRPLLTKDDILSVVSNTRRGGGEISKRSS